MKKVLKLVSGARSSPEENWLEWACMGAGPQGTGPQITIALQTGVPVSLGLQEPRPEVGAGKTEVAQPPTPPASTAPPSAHGLECVYL